MISAPQSHLPNSTELINMAHREWKSRQERKGLNDEAAWVSGWISGYLTNRRMDIINSIRSRTLEAELQKERKKLIATFKEWFGLNKCNGCPYGGNLLEKVESLRNGVEKDE
jgi:macrodomain Ter protein organizer (MatP/YcbG family)